MRVYDLRLNRIVDPVGFLFRHTVFSWKVEGARGKAQVAARIVVKKEGEAFYDTGWAELDSLGTELPLELSPRTRYTWTVSVRTDAGEEAESGEAFFETPKMDEPWQAEWIGCDDAEKRHPVFSKTISVNKPLSRARLYITGLGLFEAHIDGARVGDEYLTPYCNNYNSWVQYFTFDVTEMLKDGSMLSVALGNGWYKGRFSFDDRTGGGYYGSSWRLLAEVRLSYADGTEDVIGTDGTWTVTRTNIYNSNIYDGEYVDDTLPALPPVNAIVKDAPKGELTPRLSPPVKVFEELPAELIVTPAGETVMDLKQNMTGSFRLKVHEPRGTKIHVQVGEILQQGNFYRDNLRTAKAEYVYISDGEPHVLQPKFTFYGYRYAKIQGVTNLKAGDFTGLVMHSEMTRTGSLVTGHELINRLILNAEWGQIGNFLDVPTDCPQRDERMGWTGDAQVFSDTALYQRDCRAFYDKFMYDLRTEQVTRDGEVPNVVPAFGNIGCSAAWADAACVIPWNTYMHTGDSTVLADSYPAMRDWVEYMYRLESKDQGWRNHFHFGDWLALDGPKIGDGSLGGTDKPLIALVHFRLSATLTAKAARVLCLEEDAKKYEDMADWLLGLIRDEYITKNGRVGVNTQTAYLMALNQDLSLKPEHTRELLEQKISYSRGLLETGFVGTPLLCKELTRMGRADRAFRLLLNEEYPGWLYEVKLGATTVWERWNSVLPDGSVSDTGMNSLNHYAYGAVVGWMYADVAGIKPLAPGFRRAELTPHFSSSLKSADMTLDSAAGEWRVSWKVNPDGTVSYSCRVPFGATALLTLPCEQEKFELMAGDFSLTFMPTVPVKGLFSSRDMVAELLQNPKASEIVLKYYPKLPLVPSYLKVVSLKEAVTMRLNSADRDETLAKIDGELAQL